ncbi:MAG: hypothetical protein WDM92_15740 [Caulobacteraceae bacterium]
MRRLALVFAALLAAAGCSKQVQAPTDTGVCWHMATLNDGKVRFNRLAQNVPSLETCAADLEAMRLRFQALGSSSSQMVGAYQGQFLFLQPEGIFTATKLNGGRYLLLVRTGDGRLAKVGVMPVQ